MNCPKCGLPTLSDQRFCRSCGAVLQIITQPLAEHATVFDLEKTPAVFFKSNNQRASLVLWAFFIMFIGVAMGVIGKMLLHVEIVTVVGVLVSLAGMFLAAYSSLSPSRPKRYDLGPSSPAELPRQSEPTTQLPRGTSIEYVSSVTERTTDLLETPAAAELKQRDDGESQA